MLNEGLILMLIGMGTVFSFLILMILAMYIMGWIMPIINRIFPEEVKLAEETISSATNRELEIAIAIAKIKAM